MSKIVIIGDIHKDHNDYFKILENLDPETRSIQLGDTLMGLPGCKSLPTLDSRHQFIRGNHDKPDLIKKHPNYLGDYGFLKEDNLFFMSGACSPDFRKRKENVDWWPTEQLSYEQFAYAIKLYQKTKPRFMVTHEAPRIIAEKLGYGNNSPTQTVFEIMRHLHKPEMWLHGHYHRKHRRTIDSTRFVCLPFMGTYTIET
jgi:predicted phosphodiesterase